MSTNNADNNSPKGKSPKKKKWIKRSIILFWLGLLSPVVLISTGLFCASQDWFGELPTFREIENPESNFATEVISSDGKVLGKYFFQNRTPVRFENLSPHLVNALVATEDERFYEHAGIDARALTRAIVKGILGQNAGGGSTITQQLAKMLFTNKVSRNPIDRVKQKFKEWVISARLERSYTKEEIITMYFNKFDFLYQAVGIKSAAKIYFNTTPDKLTIVQSAILVGMAKNPSLYNPKKWQDRSKGRRNVVIQQMVRNELIDQQYADSLKLLDLDIEFTRESHHEGLSTYFREFLRSYMKNWVKTTLKPDGSEYNIYSDGLKIYTTIDSRLQRYAEEATAEHNKVLQNQLYKHMKSWKRKKQAPFPADFNKEDINKNLDLAKRRSERYRKLKKAKKSKKEIAASFKEATKMKIYTLEGEVDTLMSPMDSIIHYKYFLHHSMMSMDPQTGFIRAWVGGINHKYFQYDNVYMGKHQVGSTFKPMVYATAIDQHKYSPCTKIPNIPVVFEKEEWGLDEDWEPQNSDKKYGGELTLSQGLAGSVNAISAYLMKQVGPRKVAQLAKKMGIKSKIPEYPSICLGTPELSLYELTGAYSTFANKGIHVDPIFITKIEDRNGTILYNYEPNYTEVLSEEKAYTMLNLMEGVTRHGTSIRLRFRYQFKNDIAGKTGTTQNNMDGWFIGMVPNLITGVWTGCDDPAIRFDRTDLGQGANMALPIWALYMQKAYKDYGLNISQEPFEVPSTKMTIITDCDLFEQQNEDNSELDMNDEPDF